MGGSFGAGLDVVDRLEDGLRLHEHALPSAEGRIVHGVVAVMRPIAQIVGGKLEQPLRPGTAHDRR